MNRKACTILFAFLISMIASHAFAVLSDGSVVNKDDLLPRSAVKAIVVKSESELIGGPKSDGRTGDFKLFNNDTGYIISGVRPADGYAFYSGEIEDAGIIRPDGKNFRWRNLMGDVFLIFYKGEDPILDSRLFEPYKAEIIKDGSEGEAIVRVYGKDAEFTVRKDILTKSSKSLNLDLYIDYILKADSPVLEAKLTIPNKSEKNISVNIGLVFMVGDRINLFSPGSGYVGTVSEPIDTDALFGGGDAGISYGWFMLDDKIKLVKSLDVLTFVKFGRIKTAPGSEGSLSYFFATDEDIASVNNQILKFRKSADTGTIVSTCSVGNTKKAAASSILQILSADRKQLLNQSIINGSGKSNILMPAGDYQLRLTSRTKDDGPSVSVKVSAAKTTNVNLHIPDSAYLNFVITDRKGNALPAAISFIKSFVKPSIMDSVMYGKDPHLGMKPIDQTFLTASGKQTLPIRPGKYDVYFSHGLEYEYVKKTIAFTSGKTENVKIVLDRAVDTSGWIPADLHTHSVFSHDAEASIEDRLYGCLAYGLKVFVASDHDRISDFKPFIERLGLTHRLSSIIGTENTTKRLGHFNGFPLKYDRSKRNNGSPESIGVTVEDIIRDFRNENTGERVIVQANHPRSKYYGYFHFVGYNPDTGKASSPLYRSDFDTMEILNSYEYEDSKKQLIDWFSFLNRGRKMPGLGNSDSHEAFDSSIACPKNYVKSNITDMAKFNQVEFINSILSQHVVVSSGPFMRVNINGKAGPGDMISTKKITMKIKIEAPKWIKLDRVTVYANGDEIKKYIDLKNASTIKLNETLNITPNRDTWYVVVAEGDTSLFPVYPQMRSFAAINPIYVDVDGNGTFDHLIKPED